MTDSVQLVLDLFPLKEVEVDGIQMGVLNDGSPYLTARGLAKLCGVHHSVITDLGNDWDIEQNKPRGTKIKALLSAQGNKGEHLYLRTKGDSGETHAYIDSVCMALLEYYAFEAQQGSNETALKNYRLLARTSFRAFIYNRVGYDPFKHIPDSWKNFHERVLLNDLIPSNFFSVFREIADLVVHMIQANFPIDSHCVPDISIGQQWAQYWNENNLDSKFGNRQKHPHFYPDWFPQSKANPVEAWIYPVQSLGNFRVWLYEQYIPKSFPKYLTSKTKQGLFLPSRAELLIAAVNKKEPLQIQ